jgi:hypothetical protein
MYAKSGDSPRAMLFSLWVFPLIFGWDHRNFHKKK